MRTGFLSFLLAATALADGPSFEVASIKSAQPPQGAAIFAGGRVRIGMQIDKGRVEIGMMPLQQLLLQAFGVKQYQLQGPDWMGQQPWDIQATLPDGANPDQVPKMLENLLIERFGLKYHREKKDQDVSALVLGKPPLKLKEVQPSNEPPPVDANAIEALGGARISINGPGGRAGFPDGGRGAFPPDGGRGGPGGGPDGRGGLPQGMSITIRGGGGPGGGGPLGGIGAGVNSLKITPGEGGQMQLEVEANMSGFADLMSQLLGKPVIDATGLKGTYSAALALSMQDMIGALGRGRGGADFGGRGGFPGGGGAGAPAGLAADPGSTASVQDSIQKLGLKIETRKAPMDLIVIDKLSKTPSDN